VSKASNQESLEVLCPSTPFASKLRSVAAISETHKLSISESEDKLSHMLAKQRNEILDAIDEKLRSLSNNFRPQRPQFDSDQMRNQRTNDGRIVCHYCGKGGHFANSCRLRQAHSYLPNSTPNFAQARNFWQNRNGENSESFSQMQNPNFRPQEQYDQSSQGRFELPTSILSSRYRTSAISKVHPYSQYSDDDEGEANFQSVMADSTDLAAIAFPHSQHRVNLINRKIPEHPSFSLLDTNDSMPPNFADDEDEEIYESDCDDDSDTEFLVTVSRGTPNTDVIESSAAPTVSATLQPQTNAVTVSTVSEFTPPFDFFVYLVVH